MWRLVPEGAKSRGRSDCQKVSTYRNAVGELPATNRVERSGHRRDGHFLDRQRAYRWIKENGRVCCEAQQAVFARPFRSGRRRSSLKDFVADNEIKTLNVAGPRASEQRTWCCGICERGPGKGVLVVVRDSD